MENIIVGVIVALALGFSIRAFVRIYKGEGECGCGSSCGCSPSEKECCGQDKEFLHK
ncbi:MAG: FeoB-associated Cys-rich membrane protein [Desulfobacterales bacterium]|nr:FeoB-associated Cys-rich membrane protein [Desulfobacterales bacterium]